MRNVRTIALGAAAATGIVLSMSACSASDDAPVTAECPDGLITLSVLRAENSVPTDDQLDAYRETNECIDFDVTEVPFGQLAEKIAVTAPSANAPDIVGYDSPETQSYASQGLLLPLDEYLPDGWEEDVNDATLAENSWEGEVYSPGMQQDALALYYNKDLTDAAGIEVPKTLDDAWTWTRRSMRSRRASRGAGTTSTCTGWRLPAWGTARPASPIAICSSPAARVIRTPTNRPRATRPTGRCRETARRPTAG